MLVYPMEYDTIECSSQGISWLPSYKCPNRSMLDSTRLCESQPTMCSHKREIRKPIFWHVNKICYFVRPCFQDGCDSGIKPLPDGCDWAFTWQSCSISATSFQTWKDPLQISQCLPILSPPIALATISARWLVWNALSSESELAFDTFQDVNQSRHLNLRIVIRFYKPAEFGRVQSPHNPCMIACVWDRTR